jgi:biopolymer transport protein ExbB/TolQ
LKVALDRRQAKDDRVKETWIEAVERRRQLINQELRKFLWVLGTIASASPFIGLFGTVVGFSAPSAVLPTPAKVALLWLPRVFLRL